MSHSESGTENSPKLAGAMLLAALAGGMGWGIRGQYGHETGAMIAGVLVGLVLVLLFLPHATSLVAARAVAMFTVGISFGGSMTYGQTVGLTHDPELTGNGAAFCWGLLGLFVKGGVWIGFGGALLGMGLSGKRYRSGEMALLLIGMLVLLFVGMWLFNRPFDPVNHILPRIYFSADWYWRPGAELKPRPECWGGLLLALVSLIIYLQWVRRDLLARNLALWGCLAGGTGFALGQSVQAFHAWNPDLFQAGFWGRLDPFMNWWNMMEITFGATFGGLLALGLWLNRRRIVQAKPDNAVALPLYWEFLLLGVYVFFLVAAEFSDRVFLELFLEFGFALGLIPLIGILGGRYWPYLFVFPVVALPIAGKTLRELVYKTGELPPLFGWLALLVLPMLAALGFALWLARRGQAGQSSRDFARLGLLFATWLYFGLNFVFFRLPWPWQEWTDAHTVRHHLCGLHDRFDSCGDQATAAQGGASCGGQSG